MNAIALRESYARFLAGDPIALTALLAPDVVHHLPGRHLGGGTLAGRDALFARLVRAAGACDTPPTATVSAAAAADGFAMTLERFTARRAGRVLDQTVCVVWRFAGERCVEIWAHFADQASCDALNETASLRSAVRVPRLDRGARGSRGVGESGAA